MKKNLLVFMMLFLTSGCAIMGSTISEPIITSMPNNSFEISMRGGVMTQREVLQAEWLKVAAQKCADYEILSREFALQYDMPTLSGVIKCKKKNKSESSIASLNPPSASVTVPPQSSPPSSKAHSPPSSSMVTKQNKTNVRKSPSSKAAVIKTLEKGEEVQIIKQKDEWFLVEFSGGETGWCHNSVLSRKN